MYTFTGLGVIAAIDPGTGKTIWQFDPETWKAGRPTNLGFLHRGLSYWTDGTVERLFAGTHDAYLISVDAKSGKLDAAFGTGGRVDLTERLAFVERIRNYTVTSAPVVVRNVVISGAGISDGPQQKEMVRGDVSGFDVRSGKRLWTFRSVPQPGEFGNDSWEGDAAEYTGNTNVWSLMSVDEALGYVYLPFGTPTNDYYGGHRLGNNLFAESLVCLDATTGKRVWHFQAVHHGLWDYDFPAAPTLGTITVDGRRIDAVMQISKQGFVYVFDRRTGQPVWPIEERPVPQTKVPGEKTSPTQPFPTRPPAFDHQGFVDADVIAFTPEIKARALDADQAVRLAVRCSRRRRWRGRSSCPPTAAAATGAARRSIRPRRCSTCHRLRARSSSSWAAPPDASKSNMRLRRNGQAVMPTLDGLPLVKPPYSRITAYDMNTGTIAWQVPLGDGPRTHPLLKALNLPPLGGGRGYPLLTSTLLLIGHRGGQLGGPQAVREPPSLRAFDKKTGKEIAKIELSLGTVDADDLYPRRQAVHRDGHRRRGSSRDRRPRTGQLTV